MSSWDAGNALTFTSRGVALPHRLGQPALDTIVFRIMPDKNDSLTALTQGQIQLVAQDGLDASDAPVQDTLPGVQARYVPGNAWEQLTFNLGNPVLADANVRQAIAYGLNRDAIQLGDGCQGMGPGLNVVEEKDAEGAGPVGRGYRRNCRGDVNAT